MALIRQADAQKLSRKAVSLNLGDLQRQGDDLIADAKARADAIIAEARAERERLIADAAEIGREQGHREGFEAGRAKGHEDGLAEALESTSGELSALAERWGLALARFDDARAAMVSEARTEIVRLAAVFAEKVTKRVVELDETVIVSQIEAVLGASIRPSRLTLAIHPDDREQAQRALPGLLRRFAETEHAELVLDETLDRGSCVATLGSGAEVDASISTQIDRMVRTLLPSGAAGGGEEGS